MQELTRDEQRVFGHLQRRYSEDKKPTLTKELQEGLKKGGFSKSKRIIQRILRSLIDKELIREKMVSEGEYKGRMGYVPLQEERGKKKPKIAKERVKRWKVNYLITILENENLPQEVREVASLELRGCCSSSTKIEKGGKKILMQFFSQRLDGGLELTEKINERKAAFRAGEDQLLDMPLEDPMHEQVLLALGDFMILHIKGERDWILKNCAKIEKLFKGGWSVKFRRRLLWLLKNISLRCRKEGMKPKVSELRELFQKTFFDPKEGERVTAEAFDSLLSLGEQDPAFFERVREGCESKDEVIKNRCLKYLKENILSLM